MTLFGFTCLVVFITSILFGLVLFVANSKSKVIRAWFVESLSIALWSLGLFGVTFSKTKSVALGWQYLLDASAIFIPVLYYNFLSVFLNRKNKKFINLSLTLAGVLAIFSFTPYFKLGVTERYGFFWIDPGPLYNVFPIFFTVYTILSLYLLLKTYIQNKGDVLLRKQSIVLFFGFLIGSAGGITNFFPQLFNIYPFGNFLIVVYFIFMGYAIVKYELLDVKIISAHIFSSIIVIAFLLNLLRSITLQDWLIGFLMFIFSISFAFLLIKSVRKEVELNERLTELDELKTEFVSLATHHISTPLTTINGYVSLLQEKDYEKIPTESRKIIEVIQRSTQNLINVVRDFLDVSQIDNKEIKLKKEKFFINDLLEEIFEKYNQFFVARGVVLENVIRISDQCMVIGDRDKFKQAITNILDNCIKYAKEGKIILKNSINGDHITVEISDSNSRILPQVPKNLLHKFSSVGNVDEANIIGNSLGLYVSNQIIKAHGGSFSVRKIINGNGVIFEIKIRRI